MIKVDEERNNRNEKEIHDAVPKTGTITKDPASLNDRKYDENNS